MTDQWCYFKMLTLFGRGAISAEKGGGSNINRVSERTSDEGT
jgi:hypothetical protein